MASSVADLLIKIRANDAEFHAAASRMKRGATALGGVLAAAFSIQKVAAFSKESIKAFSEADAVWNRLGGTLQAVGVEFSGVRHQIERSAKAMQDMTTIGDEEYAATLQTLVRITGDYNASLREVQTVADLAAGAQIDLNTAAQLVGKVMVGETGTLKRYGIVVEEGADAMAVLRERFKGLAENEAQTLEGRTIQLANAWGDFKEAIGQALVEAGNGPSIMERLTEAVKGATSWVEEHTDTLKAWSDMLLNIASRLPRVIDNLERLDAFTGLDRLYRDSRITLPGMGAVGPNRAPGSNRPKPPPLPGLGGGTAVDPWAAWDRRIGFSRGPRTLGAAGITGGGSGRPGGGGLSLGLKTPFGGGVDITGSAKGAPGFLSQFAGGLKSQIMGLAASFGPLALAAAALKPVFEGIMEVLGPAIQAIAEPLASLGRIIGTLLKPAFEYLGWVVNKAVTAVSYLYEGLGHVIKAIGWLIDKINIFGGDGGIGAFGQELIDAARAARKGTKATDEATAAVEKFAGALNNVPNIISINRLRHSQVSGGAVGGGSIGGSGGGGINRFNPPAAVNVNFYGDVMDPEAVAEHVSRAVSRANSRGSTTRLNLGFA